MDGLCEICQNPVRRKGDKTCSPPCAAARHRRVMRKNNRLKREDPVAWAQEYAARQSPERKAKAKQYQSRYYNTVTKPKRKRGKPPHKISNRVRFKKRKEIKPNE